MSQNVTKRLQKLENELKSVLSIYNAADKSRKSLEKELHVDEMLAKSLKNPGNFILSDKVGTGVTCLSKSMKKSSVSDSAQGPKSKIERSPDRFLSKIPTVKKPTSAPSSSGMSTISEEDILSKRKRILQAYSFKRKKSDKINIHGKNKSEMKPSDSFDQAEWYDCSSPVCDPHMSASKTLTMAQEILEKNNYFSKESTDVDVKDVKVKPSKSDVCPKDNPASSKNLHPKKGTLEGDNKSPDSGKKVIKEKIPVKTEEVKTRNKSPSKIGVATHRNADKNSTPLKKMEKIRDKSLIERKSSRTVTWVGAVRSDFLPSPDGEKPKRPASATVQKRNLSPLASPEGNKKFDRANSLSRTSGKSAEKLSRTMSKHSRGKSTTSIPILINNKESKDAKENKENEKNEKTNKGNSKNKEKMVTFEKTKDSKGYTSEESNDSSSKPRTLSPVKEPRTVQPSPTRRKEAEAESKKMKEVLQKSNERVEELRRSKNVALDMAKQLKEKYDEIKASKQELFDRFCKIQEKNESLQHELRNIIEEKLRLQLQIEGLRQESQNVLQQNEDKCTDMLQENTMLKDRYKEMEKLYKEEIVERDVKIKQLLKERFTLESAEVTKLVQKKTAEYQALLQKHEETNKDLIERVNILEQQLQAARDKEKRYSEAKSEVMKQAVETKEELEKLGAEKADLESTVARLKSCLDYSQEQLTKLESKSKKQEQELQIQMKQLQQKTERLEDTNKELEAIQKNSRDLEDQVKTLRQSIENFDRLHQNLVQRTFHYEQQLKKEEEEREKLKKDLEKEKDCLLIKNKIIEDQQATIKQLRDKAEEAKSALKKNQSLERIIDIEREEKLELQEMVEHLSWRKEELKKKVKSLEEDLLSAPKEVVQDLQKTQTVLQELENQVQEKQKEWENHMQTLLKEKERACNVAEYATKKLMETTNEFQKQSELNKKLQRALAEALAEKDRHDRNLKADSEPKVNNVRIKEIMSELHPEARRRSSSRGTNGQRFIPLDSDDDTELFHKKLQAARSPKRHKPRGSHLMPDEKVNEDPRNFYRQEFY